MIDGKTCLSGKCAVIDGLTYVPLGEFSSLMDVAKTTYNRSTKTATVKTDSLTVTAKVGTDYIEANGHCYYTEGKILLLGGEVYLPISPIVKAFGGSLYYNARQGRTAVISSPGVAAVKKANYDADAVYWLARIISAEAGGESMKGQIAVGNVVLNRVRSRAYPNTIYGVIFDRKYGVQFTPVANGTIYKTPTADAVIAAKICLEGYSLSDTVLYFLNPRIATSSWITRNCTYAFTVGNHDFYS